MNASDHLNLRGALAIYDTVRLQEHPFRYAGNLAFRARFEGFYRSWGSLQGEKVLASKCRCLLQASLPIRCRRAST